jgi:LTXXQ motif family protein
MGYVQRLIRPNGAQKQLLDELASASAKAKAAITSACPKERLDTTDAVLSAMEKRVTALLEILKLTRPAFERFYASLDTRQKIRLEALGPARRGWRW